MATVDLPRPFAPVTLYLAKYPIISRQLTAVATRRTSQCGPSRYG